jgi:hypothetical protein
MHIINEVLLLRNHSRHPQLFKNDLYLQGRVVAAGLGTHRGFMQQDPFLDGSHRNPVYMRELCKTIGFYFYAGICCRTHVVTCLG